MKDIYNTEARFIRAKQLCREDLPQGTCTSLLKYITFCASQGMKKNRLIKIMSFLRQAAKLAEKHLSQLSEEDVIALLAKINALEISGATRNDYIIILRGYYRHVFRNRRKKYRKIRRHLKKKPCNNVREPIKILHGPDISCILQACESEQMKVICSLLWETGARIGELLVLRKIDVSFDTKGAILKLDGKTGLRYVRIVGAAPLLNEWCGRFTFGHEYIFSYSWPAFNKHLKEAMRKLGYPELYSHLFRKCRASYLSKFLFEQQTKKYFGWTPDSKMLKHYVFLSCEDANEAILKLQSTPIPTRQTALFSNFQK